MPPHRSSEDRSSEDRSSEDRSSEDRSAEDRSAEDRSANASLADRLRISRSRVSADNDEESVLSDLSIGGHELGEILQQVDQISRSLSTNSSDSQKLSEALQLTVSCAIRQTLMEGELRALALTDDLTGLYNRRGFLVSATQQLKLIQRNRQGVLLFFCDLDDLKTTNDSYGHVEGDRALVQVADALVETFRNSDILARLGGDEFAVLALDTSSHYQDLMLGRLNNNLKKAGSNSPYPLSLSIGVARFNPREPVSLAQLMAQADEAMYAQKKKRKEKKGAVERPRGKLTLNSP